MQVIRGLAAKGSCVIVGRCADAILADQAHILRVFVCADAATRETRVRTVYREPAEDLDKLEKTAAPTTSTIPAGILATRKTTICA